MCIQQTIMLVPQVDQPVLQWLLGAGGTGDYGHWWAVSPNYYGRGGSGGSGGARGASGATGSRGII